MCCVYSALKISLWIAVGCSFGIVNYVKYVLNITCLKRSVNIVIMLQSKLVIPKCKVLELPYQQANSVEVHTVILPIQGSVTVPPDNLHSHKVYSL